VVRFGEMKIDIKGGMWEEIKGNIKGDVQIKLIEMIEEGEPERDMKEIRRKARRRRRRRESRQREMK